MLRLRVFVCSLGLAACSHTSVFSPLPSNGSNASLVTRLPASASYELLYSFAQDGKPNDGRTPLADLIVAGGALYGTTQDGGITNDQCDLGCGTVFTATTGGAERVLYRFRGGGDGAGPAAGLLAINGTLFGTTRAGGGSVVCSGGCGTVFSLRVNGKNEKVLYRFTGGSGGSAPVAGLIRIGGLLYGTTEYGGAAAGTCFNGCGTVFSASINGERQTVIYRFKGGKDGSQPLGGLTLFNGTLYGTTLYGGTSTKYCSLGCGTIFKLTTNGKESVFYRFKYSPVGTDGAYPSAGLTLGNGTLYGTTMGGGNTGEGTVFKVSTSGVEHVIHRFNRGLNGTDGVYPLASLIAMKGTLYGTTRNGGAHGSGTVFKVTAAGIESLLYSFKGKPDGAQPHASLIELDGALYGTTMAGGTGAGTLFKLKP